MKRLKTETKGYVGLVLLCMAVLCFALGGFGVGFFGVRAYLGQPDSGWWWGVGVLFFLWAWACLEKL